jgi:hypothetical protein
MKHHSDKFLCMARKPRLHYVGALYHVMVRGNGGQNIFTDDEDKVQVLSPLAGGGGEVRASNPCFLTDEIDQHQTIKA